MSHAPAGWHLSLTIPAHLSADLSEALELAFWHDNGLALSTSLINGEENEERLFEAWFENEPDASHLHAQFVSVFPPGEIPEFTLEKMAARDWVRVSQQGLSPVRAGRFFLYGAHSGEPPQTVIPLHIEAGQAFGTGHHASTYGCLVLMSALQRSFTPRHGLDLGCGAGTLAIACAKLWRIPLAACDIDPIAVEVTKENARLNGVAPFIHVRVARTARDTRLEPAGPYDVIFANILAKPLKALSGDIVSSLNKGGVLILSGLLDTQANEVGSIYKMKGLRLSRRFSYQGWTSLQFHRA